MVMVEPSFLVSGAVMRIPAMRADRRKTAKAPRPAGRVSPASDADTDRKGPASLQRGRVYARNSRARCEISKCSGSCQVLFRQITGIFPKQQQQTKSILFSTYQERSRSLSGSFPVSIEIFWIRIGVQSGWGSIQKKLKGGAPLSFAAALCLKAVRARRFSSCQVCRPCCRVHSRCTRRTSGPRDSCQTPCRAPRTTFWEVSPKSAGSS